jgi:L-erythrulose 1-phosphate isomerase
MKPIYLGTNWKMYKTVRESKEYASGLTDALKGEDLAGLYLFIIPSFPALTAVREILGEGPVKLGAQNMHWEAEGPFTGEVSPRMLSEIPVEIAELGHSERRRHFHENDPDLNRKVRAALAHGLRPLLCVGEEASHREFGVEGELLATQVRIGLHGVDPGDLEKVFVAYEPAWAIGASGIPAEPDYVAKQHGRIRSTLVDLYGPAAAEKVAILYGGSVNKENFLSYLDQPGVDGLFIGRAAWEPKAFAAIIRTVRDKYLKKSA